jgi:hypothetical protein
MLWTILTIGVVVALVVLAMWVFVAAPFIVPNRAARHR